MRKLVTEVCHITTVHPPFDQRIFHHECFSLAKAGYQVTLLAHAAEDINRDGIAIRTLGNLNIGKSRLRLADRYYKTQKALQAALKINAKVYHIHDPELIHAALMLKKYTHSRVIFDSHEDNIGYIWQKQYIPKGYRQLMVWFLDYFERRAAHNLDVIITADQGVRNRFSNLGARTEILYNFPRLDFFSLPQESFPKIFDLVYHGTLPRYHLEVCFQIDDALVRRGRKLNWLLFGTIPDLEWANDEVCKRQASDRIILGGKVPHEEVSSKVLSAKIGIIPMPSLPKFQNNIPTKLFEFMALGMPVVLSDLPPSRPFVGDGKCAIMVQPDDFGAYAEAITGLLDFPSRCLEMGIEGRRKVLQEYNWELESKKLINLYQELIY